MPIALGGFHRRYKDGPLIAKVLPADTYFQGSNLETPDFRTYANEFRENFAPHVEDAMKQAEC